MLGIVRVTLDWSDKLWIAGPALDMYATESIVQHQILSIVAITLHKQILTTPV